MEKFRNEIEFFFTRAGCENPQIGEYVYYMTKLWKVIAEISSVVYKVEACLPCTRKVYTLELLAVDNIQSRSLQTEMELKCQCVKLEKLKSTYTFSRINKN